MTGEQLLLLLKILEQLVSAANSTGQQVKLDTFSNRLEQRQHWWQKECSSEAVVAAGPGAMLALTASSSAAEVAQLADGVSVLEAAGLGSCAAVLAGLLTSLAQHSSTAQLGLLRHFEPALDLAALDTAAAAAAPSATAAAARPSSGAPATPATPAAAESASGPLVDVPPPAAPAAPDVAADDPGPVLTVAHPAGCGIRSAAELKLQLQGFIRLVAAIGSSSSSSSVTEAEASGVSSSAGFKLLVLQHGIPGKLARYLVAVFTRNCQQQQQLGEDQQLVLPGSAAWAAAAARPGVPLCLQLLAALAAGHAPTAAALAAEAPLLLQLLHLLEGTAGGSTLTPLAEAALDALAAAGDAPVAALVSGLRAATAAQMKARAARKREALLASLGMVQVADTAAGPAGGVRILPSPAGVPALSPLAAELAALDESCVEDDEAYGGACMVCREGYGLNPGGLLGCYAYCRVAAAADWPGCSPPWGTPADLLFTTVSHFNVIHITCHASAKAADAALRQPKREWQGAALRNGNVLCNALLPLAAPAAGTAATAYAAAVSGFWQQQLAAPSSSEAAAAAAGSGGGSSSSSSAGHGSSAVHVSLSRRCALFRESDNSLLRVSLVAADVATLLTRFAYQLSFSEEARGGGRESNARLLLALLQLGRYYVTEAPAGDLAEAHQLLQSAAAAARRTSASLESSTAAAGNGCSSSSSSSSFDDNIFASAGVANREKLSFAINEDNCAQGS